MDIYGQEVGWEYVDVKLLRVQEILARLTPQDSSGGKARVKMYGGWGMGMGYMIRQQGKMIFPKVTPKNSW